MKSFYGGTKGENYVVSHIFSNRQSLFNDLAQGVASPVGLNEIVMVSYGNYNSDEYEMNLGIDGGLETINPFYFTHNPFLHYDPSDKAVDYETKYDILDSRYGGSYNGIKNKQAGRNVWIQLLVQGKVSFNGNFIKGVTDSNPEKYWTKNTAIHCYIATSLEAAKNSKVIAYSRFQLVENYETDETGNFVMIADGTVPSAFGTVYDNETNEFKCFEATIKGNDAGKPYYLFICVAPYTAVNFSTFSVTPSNPNSLFNYNSALFQKVLNTPQGILNPVVDVIHSDTNKYAYKFLTSSLGTTPQIEIANTITILNYNEAPKLVQAEGFTWDKPKYELQLPDQTQLQFNSNKTQLEIYQGASKEEKEILDSYQFPTLDADNEAGELRLYVQNPNLSPEQEGYEKLLTSMNITPSLRIMVNKDSEDIFKDQYILQYRFPFDKNEAGEEIWRSIIDSTGQEVNLNFQGSLINTVEAEDQSGYYIFVDNKDSENDSRILIKHGKHGDKGDKGDTGEPLQISYSFNSKINSATEINFIDLSNEQQNNYIAEALNSQDIQFPYNLYDEDMEASRLNEAFMGNIIYNNANKNLENILVFYFNTGKYAVEGEMNAIADNEFISNKSIEDEDADGNKIIKYQIISYSFLYFNNDITNTLIKNITSLDTQSLVLNTSENYDPTDKIFGAEGLTAGETNKIGTKVFDIVGYEGTEGGEGYYILQSNNIPEDKRKIALAIVQNNPRWSIKSDFCYDYYGNILETQQDINIGNPQFIYTITEDQVGPLQTKKYEVIVKNKIETKILAGEWILDNLGNLDWNSEDNSLQIHINLVRLKEGITIIDNNSIDNKYTYIYLLYNDNDEQQLKIKVNNFYTNEVNMGEEVVFDSAKTYTDRGPRFNCRPLGYYSKQTIEQDKTESILYICGYPEIGTRELFGRAYSFGSNNISQQAFSFQSGYGNKGYNKYGITVGQNNTSGFGNAIFGRNIDAGYAQMNISQGDGNFIGNYAKYNAQFGLGLESNYDHHYQFGKYNKNKKDNVLEIGNGTDALRSNVFEIDKDGKIYSNEMENVFDQKVEYYIDTRIQGNSKGIEINEGAIDQEFKLQSDPQKNHTAYLQTVNDSEFWGAQNKNKYIMYIKCSISQLSAGGSICFTNLEQYTNDKGETRNQYTKNYTAITENGNYIIYRIVDPTACITINNKSYKIQNYGIGINGTETSATAGIIKYSKVQFKEIYSFQLNQKQQEYFTKQYQDTTEGWLSLDKYPTELYLKQNNIYYIVPSQNTNKYEIITPAYIPSEYSQYTSQKWEKILNITPYFGKTTEVPKNELDLLIEDLGEGVMEKIKAEDFIDVNWAIQTFIKEGHLDRAELLEFGENISYDLIIKIMNLYQLYNEFISLECPGLNENQDVLISFNPQAGITEENYNSQKENYNLIISNSYAKTFDNEVRIYIMNDEFIDSSNNISCPILIKVV